MIKEEIYSILNKINDPELGKPITDLGMVQDVIVTGDKVEITIKLTIPGCPMKSKITEDIREAIGKLPDIREVEVKFTSMSEDERKRLAKSLSSSSQSGPEDGRGSSHIARHIVCIASGKGGVGKSTITANLAAALAQKGKKIGILDADVYGFSIPRMLGLQGNPTIIDEMIIPLEKNGIKVVSLGLFVEEDEPVIWRGPLLHRTVEQFIDNVRWDNPDVLLIDLPPGTGDVALTVAQKLPAAQLLVVTTPQRTASQVALRVGRMAEKVKLPLLGVIENMSYFQLPDGTREYIFGKGGGQEVALDLKTILLAEVPLDTMIRSSSDQGIPLFWSNVDSPAKQAYGLCAEKLSQILGL